MTRAGERVHLTPTEWRILEFLARNPGALVTRQTLLKEIWGSEQVSDSGYLRLYLSQLRKKLEADPADPKHLLTESGMGYRLVLEARPWRRALGERRRFLQTLRRATARSQAPAASRSSPARVFAVHSTTAAPAGAVGCRDPQGRHMWLSSPPLDHRVPPTRERRRTRQRPAASSPHRQRRPHPDRSGIVRRHALVAARSHRSRSTRSGSGRPRCARGRRRCSRTGRPRRFTASTSSGRGRQRIDVSIAAAAGGRSSGRIRRHTRDLAEVGTTGWQGAPGHVAPADRRRSDGVAALRRGGGGGRPGPVGGEGRRRRSSSVDALLAAAHSPHRPGLRPARPEQPSSPRRSPTASASRRAAS